ncbi:MAG: DUF2341 domain-containing protein [Candidatus Aenigmatarchaeota archaeon]
MRFTDSDGVTLLNYWIESGCNSANTKIWVKVPSIPANLNKTIYLYYGNPSASSASNATNTLDVYSDFQDGSLQGWSDAEINVGSPGCAADYPDASVDSTTGNPSPSSKKGPEQGNGYNCYVGISKTISLPGNVNISIKVDNRAYSTTPLSSVTNAYIGIYQGTGITGTQLWLKALVEGGTTDTGWVSYGPYNDTNTTGQTTVTIFLFTSDGWLSDYDKTVWFDNIIVRKYTYPEPSVSVGSEDVFIASWLNGFPYRRPITINNTQNSNSLTNYQVLVTLDTASLILEGKMRSDCSDVRFTDSDGVTLLNYWIESGCNSANTKIWVKVPSIPASSTKTIYLYYGNPSASSASNGENTFEFFDDFLGSSLNTSKWTQYVGTGASITVSNGILTLSKPASTVQAAVWSKNSFSNVRMRTKVYPSTLAAYNRCYRWALMSDNTTLGSYLHIYVKGHGWVVDDYDYHYYERYLTSNNRVTVNIVQGWLTYDTGWINNTRIIEGYNSTIENTFTTEIPDVNLYVNFAVGEAAGVPNYAYNLQIDWVFVSKYTYPEPTTSVGSEDVLIASWLNGFPYRRPITINNTQNSNSLTNYQVLVTLDTASLISAGKMRSDCGDVRFTDSDGVTLLNYWIESGCNSANTKIWVKVPSIPASSTKTIYLYYGNPSASSQSHKSSVLIEFSVSSGAIGVLCQDYCTGGQTYTGNWTYSLTNEAFMEVNVTRYSGTSWDWCNIGHRMTSPSNYDFGTCQAYGNCIWNNCGTYNLTNYLQNLTSVTLEGYWTCWDCANHGTVCGFCTAQVYFLLSGYKRKYAYPEPTTSVGSEDVLITPSGDAKNWSWKIPSIGEKIKSGSATNWTWITFQENLDTSQYQHRRNITVNNTQNSNSLTDYQVLVTLDTASLISAGKMRSDCGDVRFTDSDGVTLLNYWIESGCNSANTKIWVKVPSIPANLNKTIYLYYGNPSASSASNADSTLDFFDDFEVLDTTNKWEIWLNEGISGSFSSNGTHLIITLNSNSCTVFKILRTKNFNMDENSKYLIEMKNFYQYSNNGGGFTGIFRNNSVKDTGCNGDVAFPYPTTFSTWVDYVFSKNVSGTYYYTSFPGGNTSYVGIRKIGDGQFVWISANGSSAGRDTLSGTYKIAVGVYGGFSASSVAHLDRISVRKYTSPEPTTSIGAEETPPLITSSIRVPFGTATNWIWR